MTKSNIGGGGVEVNNKPSFLHLNKHNLLLATFIVSFVSALVFTLALLFLFGISKVDATGGSGGLFMYGADGSIVFDINSSGNLEFSTTTGSKIGTATDQKLSFWNATPITQPASSTAIDTLLTNLGLRASGGSANFDNAMSVNTTDAIKIPVGTTAQRPATPANGMFRLNATSGKLEYYNNGWSVVGLDNRSCKTILDNGGSNGDGIYTINPSGTSFQIYCDMTFNGGGWTLVAQGCDSNAMATGNIRTNPLQYVATNWKLSDADINKIRTAGTYQILMRGTAGGQLNTSRWLQTTTNWDTTVTMSGINYWNGSSFAVATSCIGQDLGPSACTPSGYYFNGNTYTTVYAATSDFRWRYINYTNKCLFRTIDSGDTYTNGDGSDSTLIR